MQVFQNRLRSALSIDRLLVTNLASLFAWQGLNYILPLITLPYVSRVLGVEQFGVLGFATSVFLYLGLLTDWGFAWSANQRVAANRGNPARLNEIFWDTIFAKLILSLLSFAALAVLLVTFEPAQQHSALFLFCGVQLLGNVLTADWFLQGLEQMSRFVLAGTIGRIAPIPFVFLLVHSPDDVAVAGLLQASSAVIGSIVCLRLAFVTGFIKKPRFAIDRIWGQLQGGFPLFIFVAAAALYSHFNFIALTVAGAPAQVGLLSGADKIRRAVLGLMSPISTAMYPRIVARVNSDTGPALPIMMRLLAVQGVLSLGLTIVTIVAAPYAVGILLGPNFSEAVIVLQAYAPSIFFLGLSNSIGIQMMLPFGYKKQFSAIIVACGLLHLLYMLPLARHFGARGVATSVSITEFVVVVAMTAFLLTHRRDILASQIKSNPQDRVDGI